MSRSRLAVTLAALALCAVIGMAAFAVFDGGTEVLDLSLPESTPEPAAVMVYITQNGGIFHRAECSTIAESKNLRHMDREEAVGNGFKPCQICKP